MKVKTVEQYKVLRFIQERFKMDCVEIKIVDDKSLKVTDKTGDNIVLSMVDNEVEIVNLFDKKK